MKNFLLSAPKRRLFRKIRKKITIELNNKMEIAIHYISLDILADIKQYLLNRKNY